MTTDEAGLNVGKRIRKALKVLLWLVGVCIAGVVVFSIFFASGEDNIELFCAEVTPGSAISELPALAAKAGVTLRLPGSEKNPGEFIAHAYSAKSFGRHTCSIDHDGKFVVSAKNEFHD